MNETQRKIIGLVVVIAVLGGIFILETRKPERSTPVSDTAQDINVVLNTMTKKEKVKRYELAKEVSTPDGFINTEQIAISELIGEKVILVDFWTYTCINCQRTIPFLNSWHDKYKDDGLVILGVHTPEFEFEKEYDNVLRAVEKFGVEYAVILDNDYSTWNAYRNRYWPRKYLIDVDGFIVYDHIGEGGYEETEKKIVEALNELKERKGEESITMNESVPKDVDIVDASKPLTPEIYLGASRIQYLANLPAQNCLNGTCDFSKISDVALNTYALSGTWNIQAENATLESNIGSIFLKFTANKVNLVAGAETSVRAEIYLDGELISEKMAGGHVMDSAVQFKENQLHNLVDLRGQYGEYVLEIRFLEGGVSAFAFTFG